LENFSGYSVEAVRQDFHATVFLTGVESIFVRDTEVSHSPYNKHLVHSRIGLNW
jgi:hypothetical protein